MTIDEYRRSLLEMVAAVEWNDRRAVAAAQSLAKELFDPRDPTFIEMYNAALNGRLAEPSVIEIVITATQELLEAADNEDDVS